MLGTAAVGRTNRYRYYTCYFRHRYGKAACATDLIDAERLDQAVLEALLATFQDEALLDRAVTDFRRSWNRIFGRPARFSASVTELDSCGSPTWFGKTSSPLLLTRCSRSASACHPPPAS